tara:strand:+ start:15062 stop:15313 length:252 start_codon:yes stop_codon:yes gene_type:complete
MSRIEKTNVPFLIKDNYNGAVLNTNVEALNAYKAKKKKLNEKLSRIDRLEIEVLQMKTEIKSQSKDCKEIKQMLGQLLGKIDG